MGVVAIALVSFSGIGRGGRTQPVQAPDSHVYGSEAGTSAAGNAVGTLVAPADCNVVEKELFWWVSCNGADTWITFGPAPVAAAGTTFLMHINQTYLFRAKPGDKAAFILA